MNKPPIEFTPMSLIKKRRKDKNKDFIAELLQNKVDFDTVFFYVKPSPSTYHKYFSDLLGEGVFEKACKFCSRRKKII